jgi:hypothetical protein
MSSVRAPYKGSYFGPVRDFPRRSLPSSATLVKRNLPSMALDPGIQAGMTTSVELHHVERLIGVDQVILQ